MTADRKDEVRVDVVSALGAVERQVAECGEHEGRAVRKVVAVREYGASRESVWDALTRAERIGRWLAPVEGDLRLGGRYQLQGNAGGEITQCVPPEALAVTWEFAGELSWVEVRLTALEAERTRLVLEHRAPVSEHWGTFGPGAVGVGWELGLLGLALHLESGGSATPEAGMAWAMSADGLAFMRGSSERWGEAAIAGG